MTNKLYLSDSYLTEFDAKIIERGEIDKNPAVVLDQTLFYPSSGGQQHDIGNIENVNVVDVCVENDKIWHVLSQPVIKDQIKGKIDWPRRFDFMQQHTGFHILAQSFLRLLKVETLSSYLGETYGTIDVDIKQITWEEIEQVELLANQIIRENRPVKAYFVEQEQLNKLHVRKAPEFIENVRLVDIDNYDLDPCGGTHVKSTGEVGIVKILKSESIRGYRRFTFVAGNRAIIEFQRSAAILREMASRFTTSEDELLTVLDKSLNTQKELYKANEKLNKFFIEYSVKELVERTISSGIVEFLFDNMELPTLRSIASSASKNSDAIFLLAASGSKPSCVFATSKKNVDLRLIFNKAMTLIDGKGGGQPGFVQGTGKKSGELAQALQTAKTMCEKLIN